MNDFFLELRRKFLDFFNDSRFHCYLCIFVVGRTLLGMLFAILNKFLSDLFKRPDVYKVACYCRRGSHLWTNKVCASTFALSTFKIPV